ncbi:MAG: cobalamin-dependent protein [Deltaproteobacteria bacterium]|nr:cobalamin-dependent protein [Deltaproteobacteria bacterium]
MKKKIVLIAFFDKVSLSLRLLSSILKKHGNDTSLIYFKDDRTVILDHFIENSKFYQFINNGKHVGCGGDVNPPTQQEFDILKDKIKEVDPDFVGISTRSSTKDLGIKVAEILKEELPNAVYVAGGYGPTTEPEYFLETFDYVCLGEGEPFAKNIDYDLKSIPNIGWREGDKFIHNKLATHSDLDELPYPDWTSHNKFLIEDNKIVPLVETYDRKTYDLFASRGCPSNCSYCMANQWRNFYIKYNSNKYPKVRVRSTQSVIDELSFAKKEYDIDYVRFMDSIFGYSEKWLFQFLDLYDSQIGLDYFCNLDVRFTNKRIIKRLKESSLRKSTVGIQAVDEEVRQITINRKISDSQLIDYAWMIHEHSINFQYDILHWNPFDTEETLSKGVSLLKKLPRNKNVAIFELKFFPESKIGQLYRKEKPKYLPNNIYEFWAWVYIMVLKSDRFDSVVDFVQKYDAFKKTPVVLKNIYNETIANFESDKKIISRRNILKGELITTVMLDSIETNASGGINFDERFRLINLTARRDIEKNIVLQWDDFFGSYGYK